MRSIGGTKLKSSLKPYREIITKATCGDAKKVFRINQLIPVPEGHYPTQILGTTITKLQLATETSLSDTMYKPEPGIQIGGSFEIHVWYAHKNGKATEIVRQIVQFTETIPVTDFDHNILNLLDAKVEVMKSPECLETSITKENKIKVEVEIGVYAEIVGETKVAVYTYQSDEDDD
ncbi:MAG: outer spore coat protein CotE [Bacillota bacterium]|jgi:spore coat protein E